MKIADKVDNKIVAKFNFPFGDNRFNETLQQIKNINGSVFDKSKRVWNLPLTKTTYEDLISSGFEINKGLEDWYLDSSLKETLKPKIEIDGLFPFQNEGVAFVEFCQGRAFIADECGCISKDAKIIVNRNGGARQITLKELYEKFNGISGRWDLNTETFTRSLDTKTNQFKLNKIIGVIHKGIRPVHKIITKSHNIKATSDHIFFSENGEKELSQLKIGEKIFVNGQKICLQCGTDKKIITYKYAKFKGYCKDCVYKHLRSNNPDSVGESIDKDGYVVVTKNLTYHPREKNQGIYKHRLVCEAFVNGVSYDEWLEIIKYGKFDNNSKFLTPDVHVHHKDGDKTNNNFNNLEMLSGSAHRKKHDNYKNFGGIVVPKLEKVISIEYAGEEEVFDIQMQSPHHNFIANGIVVHNCGKTIQTIAWLNLHRDKTPIIIVCPATIKEKWKYEIVQWSEFKESDIILLSGRTTFDIPKDKKIVIINYDILQYWLEPLMQISPKVLVGDECFVAGTKILTPDKGEVNIEDLKIGDSVYNAIGIGKILKTYKNPSLQLIKIHLSNGQTIISTPNHPFFTEIGWVNAKDITNRFLFTQQEILDIVHNNIISRILLEENENEMFYMSNAINGKTNKNTSIQRQQVKKTVKACFLRRILFSEVENEPTRNQSENIYKRICRENKSDSKRKSSEKSESSIELFYNDEEEQSNAQRRNQKKSERNSQEKWTNFYNEGRKWEAITKAASPAFSIIREGLASGISNFIKSKIKKTAGLSYLLQSGYCFSRKEILDRGRWLFSQSFTQKNIGHKKGNETSGIRVERVEILESGNYGKSSKSDRENFVYNIEVSGHPSYFAENILVHNCHAIKHDSAQRTKAIKILSKKIPHIIGLSGTPIENRPIEFFNALNMIRPDVFPNKFKYALKFCNAKKNQWGWDLTGSSNREELHKLLTDTVMIRRKKVDVLPQLPTKTRSLIPITIDNMKEYWEAQNDIISWIDKNEGSGKALRAMGSETLVKIVKLQQITSKGKIDSAISWIEDFIEETEEKLVVFCKFTNTIDILKEKFKNSCVVIDGRTPTKDRMRIIDDEFVNNKEKRLFIGNIQIAVGFNLTVASNALYVEHSFKPSDHLQSEDRLARIGAKNAITCWYLIALNTIDEIIVNTIHKKMKIIDVIIDGASECGNEDSALDEIMQQLKASKDKID